MLDLLIAGILIADMNPADFSGKTMYPSGVKDFDKHIFHAPPESPYPILNLYRYFIDGNGKMVEAGMYMTVISEDEKNILLYQGGEHKGTFPINEIEHKKYPYRQSSAIYHHKMPLSDIEVKFEKIRAKSFIKTN